MKKLTALILAIALVFALCVPAAAANITSKQVSITYRGIRVVVDGELLVPRDGDGNLIEPFILDGSTYLPIRAVGAALGLGVDWDDATSTAVLTSGGTVNMGAGTPAASNVTLNATIYYRGIRITLDGEELIPLDYAGNVVEPFIMNGTTYLPLRAVATVLGLDVNWYDPDSTAFLGFQPDWLCVRAERYDRDELTYVQKFSYDKLGLCSGYELTYAGESKPAETCAYSYSTTSDDEYIYYNLVKEYYDPENYTEYSYDGTDRLIAKKTVSYGETTTSKYSYAGDTLTTITVTGTGYKAVHTLGYNYQGDVTAAATVVTDTATGATYNTAETYAYKYNADGSHRSETYTYTDDEGSVEEHYEYEYDAYGRVVKITEYDGPEGERYYVDTTVYEYMEGAYAVTRESCDTYRVEYSYIPDFS